MEIRDFLVLLRFLFRQGFKECKATADREGYAEVSRGLEIENILDRKRFKASVVVTVKRGGTS